MVDSSSGDNAMLGRILSGISDLQRDINRVTDRLDALETNQQSGAPSNRELSSSLFSPGISPGKRVSYKAHSSSLQSMQGPRASTAMPPFTLGKPPVSLRPTDPSLNLWTVVPAGGAGTRLWPLSRESCPKFLLDLTGQGRTLIQNTWDRLLPLSGADKFMVVTGQAHVDAVKEQLPNLNEQNVFAEPSQRESMGAIGLAAAVLLRRDPDAVLGSFAADHIISGRDAFEASVREAVAVAREGFLVTIGIAPSYPSTGFGYIKLGEPLAVPEAPNAHRVLEFKEKPDARTASAYLATGDYRWNGGMFVVKAKTLMALLEQYVPELYTGLTAIADAWDTPRRNTVLSETWPQLPKIAIDHAVAEPASKVGKVAVVPATFGWDDVGDFASLSDLIPAEKNEARVLGDPSNVITEGQVGGIIIPASGRKIACLGMDDVVVVDTEDALLITTRARSQDVKKIVSKCKKNHPELC